jgi:tetratricopeptide (TPR) repeat protein
MNPVITGKHLFHEDKVSTMRSVLSCIARLNGAKFFQAFFCCFIGFLIVAPVVGDDGYTQGSPLGAPDWLLQRLDTSIAPDFYTPSNKSTTEVIIPSVSSYLTAGNNLLIAGSYSDAKHDFESAIGLKPDSYEAWLGRGMALEGMKRYQTAIDSYEKAISLSESETGAWVAYAGKGRVLIHLQKYEDAVKAFETAIDEFSRSGSLDIEDLVHMYEKLASAQEMLGNTSAAEDAARKAEDLKSTIGNTTA